MLDLLSKEEFTENDILNILNSRLEESINIEFKSGNALSNTPNHKKEISKDVSAFANSDGGLIFYGINEDNHIASSLSYIDGNQFNKEWLENIITTTIQQRINGLKIIPVRFENKIEQTVYVVKIPKSSNSPHLHSDKRYYRRYNFQSVAMEEYEIRDAYLKYKDSKVSISNLLVRKLEDNDDTYNFNIEIHIVNNGVFIADKYKIACNIKDADGIKIYSDKPLNITNKIEDGVKISTSDIIPLFPNERLNVLNFNLEILKSDFPNFTQTAKFEFYVYGLGEVEIESNSKIIEMMEGFVNTH